MASNAADAMRRIGIRLTSVTEPSRVTAAGQPPKLIDEYVGLANTGQDGQPAC